MKKKFSKQPRSLQKKTPCINKGPPQINKTPKKSPKSQIQKETLAVTAAQGCGGLMANPNAPPMPRPLYKQRSWAPDAEREEAWLRRKGNHKIRRRRSQSVTDEDLQELKGSIELGFGFQPDSPELDPKLTDTLPALGFYCAVNKHYNDRLSRCSSSSSISSDNDSVSCSSIIDPGDEPEMVKMRLKQWAQVVACSVRQFSGELN